MREDSFSYQMVPHMSWIRISFSFAPHGSFWQSAQSCSLDMIVSKQLIWNPKDWAEMIQNIILYLSSNLPSTLLFFIIIERELIKHRICHMEINNTVLRFIQKFWILAFPSSPVDKIVDYIITVEVSWSGMLAAGRSSAPFSPHHRELMSPSSADGAAALRDKESYDPRMPRPHQHKHGFHDPKLTKVRSLVYVFYIF